MFGTNQKDVVVSVMKIQKITSGGQTGADMGGLLAGESLGIPTGGFAAKGFRTELGPNQELGTRFHLEDTGVFNYIHRTRLNVHRSDGTAIFGKLSETGSGMTRRFAHEFKKPCVVVSTIAWHVEPFREWLLENHIRILNIAGNRESKNIGIQTAVKSFLILALEGWNND